MTELRTPPTHHADVLSGFELPTWPAEQQAGQFEAVLRDLRGMTEDGPSRLAVITDWDGVYATLQSDGVEGSNWSLLREHMVGNNAETHRQLFNDYHPKELANTLTFEDSKTWEQLAHECLVGASLSAILEDVKSRIRLREGTTEFNELCRELGVSVVARSTAFSQIIRHVAKDSGLHFGGIDANTFITDRTARRTILGVKPSSFTHSHGKHVHDHRRRRAGRGRSNVISTGDRPHDAGMVNPSHAKRLIPIAISNGRQATIAKIGEEAYAKQRIEHGKAGNRLISIEPGLLAVTGLVRAIANR